MPVEQICEKNFIVHRRNPITALQQKNRKVFSALHFLDGLTIDRVQVRASKRDR